VALLTEHLVGRAEELLAIDHALAQLDRGESAAVEVRGEPGIGKTRLLAELAGRADALGQLVLSGSASELERDLPFGLFVDSLDEYLQGLEPQRLEALDDDVRTELATVFPSLSRFAGACGTVFPHERYRTPRAVRELLERLTASKPLVLMLDDVHWGDSASVELLGALLRRPPDAAVLIALAVRPLQMPERLSSAL
jgi:predicted ATPase